MSCELAPCRELACVADVRVQGAIGVVQLRQIANMAALKAALVAEGVWVRPFRDIVYLTPAFTITPAELTRLTQAVTRACR